jgi:hypothetical protein
MNKVSRVKNDNFTIISNVFLKDKNLSIKAKGFLAVVMGLPSNWEFSIDGVCSILKEGKTSIYNVIDELKEYGYCIVVTTRDGKGRICGNDYKFYEEPQIDSPQVDSPRMENPNMDNQPQLSTNSINNLFNKEKEDKKESKDESLPKKESTWRDDFDLFVSEVHKAKDVLLQDKSFRVKQERYYPNLDYELSLHKMVEDYWSTEEAWKKRKRQKKNQEGIDMVATLKKGFSQSFNRVYKQTNRAAKQQADLFSGYSPRKVSERAKDYLRTIKVGVAFEKDGVTYLKDDTFIQEGKRYYRNKFGLLIEVPIGLVARPNEKWEYSKKTMVWVQDEQTITVDDYMF